jgi:hypothetical protein
MAAEAVRLYVGGLPPGITAEELAGRFAAFGEVVSAEVAPPRAGAGEAFPRDFGFVTLEPKDAGALERALQAYRGAKWRGGTLRCAAARPAGPARLRAERAEDATAATAERVASKAPMPLAEEGTTLHLRRPFSKELATVRLGGGEQREAVLAAAAPAVAADVWRPLEAPSRDSYAFEQLLQRESAAFALRPPPKRPAEPLVLPPASRARGRAAAGAARPGARDESPEDARPAAVVNFMSAADEPGALAAAPFVDLSRFGGDSEDEGGPALPQVDGAADSDEDEGGSEEESGSGESSEDESGGDDESGSGDESSSDKSSSSESSDTSSEESSGSEPSGGAAPAAAAPPAAAASSSDDEDDAEPDAVAAATGPRPEPDEDLRWLEALLPEGAAFYASEPPALAEATWRAERDVLAKDYRDKRRQALRAAGRGGGGGGGKRGAKR